MLSWLFASPRCFPAPTPAGVTPSSLPPRARPITAAEIDGHLRLLADDALGGRGVGSPGIELAARYHENIFAALGLRPPFDSGRSYRQRFAVRGSRPDDQARLIFSVKGQTIEPRLHDDFVLNTHLERGPPRPAASWSTLAT